MKITGPNSGTSFHPGANTIHILLHRAQPLRPPRRSLSPGSPLSPRDHHLGRRRGAPRQKRACRRKRHRLAAGSPFGVCSFSSSVDGAEGDNWRVSSGSEGFESHAEHCTRDARPPCRKGAAARALPSSLVGGRRVAAGGGGKEAPLLLLEAVA